MFPAHLHDDIPVTREHLKLEALGQLSFFDDNIPAPLPQHIPDESVPQFHPEPKPHGKEAAARNDD